MKHSCYAVVYVCIFEDLFSCLCCCFFNSLCLLAGSSVVFFQIASLISFFFNFIFELLYKWSVYWGTAEILSFKDTLVFLNVWFEMIKHLTESISTLLFTPARDFISWKHAILSFNVSLVNVLFPHFIVAFTFYSALFTHLSIWIKQVCESSQCMQTEKACSKVRDP